MKATDTDTVFFRQSCMQTVGQAHTRRYFITFNPHYCLWYIWGHLVAKFRTLMSFFSQLFFSACLSVRVHVCVCEQDIRSKGDYSESHILWSIKGCRVNFPVLLIFFLLLLLFLMHCILFICSFIPFIFIVFAYLPCFSTRMQTQSSQCRNTMRNTGVKGADLDTRQD